MDRQLVLPEDVQPQSRSLKFNFQIASRHGTHLASSSILLSSPLSLLSIQPSQALLSIEFAIKVACNSGERNCHYFSKHMKKILRILFTKNIKWMFKLSNLKAFKQSPLVVLTVFQVVYYGKQFWIGRERLTGAFSLSHKDYSKYFQVSYFK